MSSKLSEIFEEELRDKSYRAKKECRYNPTYFIKMLNELGGVETAKQLIRKAIITDKLSDGYTTLFIAQRLDLTMEASVADERFKELFTEEEVNYCKKILKK